CLHAASVAFTILKRTFVIGNRYIQLNTTQRNRRVKQGESEYFILVSISGFPKLNPDNGDELSSRCGCGAVMLGDFGA
ncbi:hypothetical protein SB763_33640, partial [Burkholderia sp. SIMBA_042]|uniref:hypothetical protein n=1 Tax=Burkholderia sp. SIMBA_042 TaxID=3085783 RepID=UPI00397C583A